MGDGESPEVLGRVTRSEGGANGILSGANGWNEIEDYADSKIEWFKSFLTLPGGIPSHDTFNRVLSALDPEWEKGFVAWVSSIAKLTAGKVVAIEGKALRDTCAPGNKTIVHMVSAWANSNSLVLAQRRVDEQSNELTAIPKLLDALELSGTVAEEIDCGHGRVERRTCSAIADLS